MPVCQKKLLETKVHDLFCHRMKSVMNHDSVSIILAQKQVTLHFLT